ncbi:MAG: ribosome assembly cofactor RimP [Flavobacteriaceae bacterium CG_4_8_14_3_um_filter_34_10]|nr:ribosome assembly cofactor RimP [Flavobacteriia bacterium]OIP49726.1 MAG: ribosome assembly cofactor RimP [Flavobacteriaceae bacterium CG2_30_34_30]PIQ19288.1 MAG: ribosome assembly cofactor RimP [Flavobacteriaceae bacterium CG18_big_fil_WC_8_21_14_2_50_34_36]PIV48516.1 MAG: ribosome assembly cofactor RimP [Flavobacteriaceae bacterium CG02_land_8_20_14_3_00_34_13]PIX08686.1 MAG: ribosome assembly cofactor RimP [Flavobacteriaceae bacterium CG_4_8_14_3_um_filter_34_10]PIZ07535.1 MAG: ribosome
MLKEKITDLLEEALSKNQSLFLINFDMDENNNVKIILDGDTGVTLHDCIAVSRAIEHNIDRDEYDFALEVASAGATSPLILPRQYLKNIGRTLEVKQKEGGTLEGILSEVTEEEIKITWEAREPKPVGKGKITVQRNAVIPFSNIKQSKVKIIFN